MNIIDGLGLDIAILTNGYKIDSVLKCIPQRTLVELSIKSIDHAKFKFYTGGRDLDRVLRNLETLLNMKYKVIVETILIPQFNDAKDIEKLAMYISAKDPSTPLIIDEYIPVPQAPWGRPTPEDLREAYKRAKKHLDVVMVRSSYPEFGTSKRLGNALVLFP